MNDDQLARIAAGMSRRDFMKLLGATMALAGVTGCVREPSEPVFPYIHPPAEGAGTDLHFATAMTLDGFATGLLVKSINGRPIKIEGNPLHPASRGASSAIQQAALLQLYDPHRARGCTVAGRTATWAGVVQAVSLPVLRRLAGDRGAGLLVLMDPVGSPLLVSLIERLRTELPDLALHFVHGVEAGAALDAHQAAFGRPVVVQPDLGSADVLVTLAADPLACGPWHLRQARDFHDRCVTGHRVEIHAIETMPSSTGTLSRHRLAATPAMVTNTALALVARIAERTGAPPPAAPADLPGAASDWMTAAADDLLAHRGAGVVMAGPQAPAGLHVAAAALNAMLGNVGRTVWYNESPVYEAGAVSHQAQHLADRLAAGDLRAMIITATNPVYVAPGDFPLGDHVARSDLSVYLGEHHDETAAAAKVFAPRAHFLESWGAGRSWDGTVTPMQPLIAPMFEGHTEAELLASMLGDLRPARGLLEALHPEIAAPEVLQRGMIDGSALPRVTPPFQPDALALLRPGTEPGGERLPVVFPPGAGTHDGRFAGNPWLQELPDPIAKLTWDNALLLAPETAARLGLSAGDEVQLAQGERRVTVPVLPLPGHAPDAGSLAMGYGRQGDGILTDTIGADTSRAPADGLAVPRRGHHHRGRQPPSAGVDAGALVDPRPGVGDHRRCRRTNPAGCAVSGHAGRCRRIRRRPVGDDDRPRRCAPAAARASSPARRRTTSPSSARQGVHATAARCTGCGSTATSTAIRAGDRIVVAADALPALREGAVRIRLPRQRDGAQRRRPERDGLQPLRRHALLLEQLPVQGAALQLVQLHHRD